MMQDPQITPAGGLSDGGAAAAPGPVAARPSKKLLPTETLLVVATLGVSVAVLSWMRHEGMRSGVTFADVRVEYERDESVSGERYRQIMQRLTAAQSPLDVALTDFARSPFMLPRPEAQVRSVGPDPLPPPDEISEQERLKLEMAARQQRRREELLGTVKGLDLQGVMDGRVPVARVNGRTVRIGDRLGELEVFNISGRSVSFAADGEVFIVTMDTTDVKVEPRRRKR